MNHRLLAGRRELGVLGEEAVAGVNRSGPGPGGRLDDLRDRQIALGRHRGPDQEGLVGLAHVGSVAVGLRVDRDGADPHLLQGAGDPDRDLAAVGDQHLLEHGAGVYLGLNPPGPLTAGAARLPRHADRAAGPLDCLRRATRARRGGRGGRRSGRDHAGPDRPRRRRGSGRGGCGGRARRDRAGAGGGDVVRPRIRGRSPRLRLLGGHRGAGTGLREGAGGAGHQGGGDRREPPPRGLRAEHRGRDRRGGRRTLGRPAPHRPRRRDRRRGHGIVLRRVPGARGQGVRAPALADGRRGRGADPRGGRRRGRRPSLLGHLRSGRGGGADPGAGRRRDQDLYPSHTREQTAHLLRLGEELGLAATGSSDYHGPTHKTFSRFGAYRDLRLGEPEVPAPPA